MKLLYSVLFLAVSLAAQSTHTATLTWVDDKNPAGTTYSVNRAVGLCSGSPTFSKIATGITVKTYVDSTVTPGPYCFAVTATFNGVESANSNTALANVPAFSPSNLSVVVQ